MKQRFILFVSTLVISIAFGDTALAYDVEVDGIYYNLIEKGKVAEVTYKNENYNSYSGIVIIPNSIKVKDEEFSITGISDHAFESCNTMDSISIPKCLSYIGTYSFFGCENLKSLSIPNTVKSIGWGAFYGCSSLKSIEIPSSVTTIETYTFRGCKSLEIVKIPNSVNVINQWAFHSCEGLKSVYIQDIESWCKIDFNGSQSNPLEFANNLYVDNRLVNELVIPNSVTTIGKMAFIGFTGLKKLSFSNSVVSIGKNAFQYCTNLTNLTIPNSVISIGGAAFRGCTSLTNVNLSNSLSTIEAYLFENCTELKSIVIPNGVKKIESYAFWGCSKLATVKIGSSIVEIGYQSFMNCKNIQDFYINCEIVPITSSDSFEGSFIEYAALHVPAPAIEEYKSAKPWSDFGTIKAIEGTEVDTKQCATPVISYSNGELFFSCETEGAKCTYNIKSPDITYDGTFYQNMKLPLYAYYDIYCEATAEGYTKSDLATAKLYWLPTDGTLETNINTAETRGVMASSSKGFIILSGLNTNEQVSFYSADGKELGSVKAIDGTAQFAAQSGTVVVAKIGKESLKIGVK